MFAANPLDDTLQSILIPIAILSHHLAPRYQTDCTSSERHLRVPVERSGVLEIEPRSENRDSGRWCSCLHVHVQTGLWVNLRVAPKLTHEVTIQIFFSPTCAVGTIKSHRFHFINCSCACTRITLWWFLCLCSSEDARVTLQDKLAIH